MTHEYMAVILDERPLTLDEISISCKLDREWIIERVRAGVLLSDSNLQPAQWLFSSQDMIRVRRIWDVESKFDANPELAGLVADLFEELERLRIRLRRME